MNELNITAYGAVSGGETLCTRAIQEAVDTCANQRGGRVVVPRGTWLSGTIVLKDHVELRLSAGAIILGSMRREDYLIPNPDGTSHKINQHFALLYAKGAENIAITGTGVIDGQRKNQYPRMAKRFLPEVDERPCNILFDSCRKIKVTGITMRDSGKWNQHYLNCEDVKVSRIHVCNLTNRNNDGIDIDGCRRFVLSNSTFDCDDDGICLKSSGPAACENITVTNCVVSSHCNAIKLGTESTGGFRHVAISNCFVKPSAYTKVVYGTKEGCSGITVGCVDGGLCEDINISDIDILGTQAPIFVRLGKRNRPHTTGAKVVKDSTMNDISFRNIAATGCGDLGCAFLGLPGNPIKRLRLHNIKITFPGGGTEEDSRNVVQEELRGYPQAARWGKLPVYGVFIRNVDNVILQDLDLRLVKKDQRSPVGLENINGLMMSGVSTETAEPNIPRVLRKHVRD